MKQYNTILTNRLLFILRIFAALLAISIFVPFLNPAKISALINKNLSFFTSGIAYPTLMSGFKRALTKEWVSKETLNILFSSSTIASLGLLASGFGACLTLGENRLKRISTSLISFGTAFGVIGMLGILLAHSDFTQSSNLSKIAPTIPIGFYILMPLIVICFILSVTIHTLLPKPVKGERLKMQPKYYLFLLFMPFIALCFLFSYLPLWGWRYGFFNYKAGLDLNSGNFVGFKWFTYLFQNEATKDDIVRVLKNTLAMSGLGIATSWMAMAFAMFLSEIKTSRYRRIIQTFTTIPNFISWVLVYAFAFSLFSTEGLFNRLLIDFGVTDSGINFLLGSDHIWLKMLLWGIWKGLGWGAIIYLAAISGIDQQLYEAATVDGAGRFQRMWHITVPGLLPTYFVLLMLSIAGILSNGMDQYFVFKNSANKDTIEVLDLYVYTLGLGSGSTGNIPLATVVGMLKSLISITLLFFANGLSKVIRKESII